MPRPAGKQYEPISAYLRPEYIKYIKEAFKKHHYSDPSHFLRTLLETAVDDFRGENCLGLRKN